MRWVLWMAVCLSALAQSKTEFEVASIKPSAPDARGSFIRPGPGGGITVTNMTLKDMISIAWRVQPFQISGGPPWMDSLRFDVTAKPEARTAPAEVMVMLQALLADRFQVSIHRETKELPIYALVLARKDGKLGASLTEAKEGGCEPMDPSKPPAPPKPGERPQMGCGGMMIGPGRLNGVGVPLANLTPALSRILGRTVIDKTGLSGNYDVSLEWAPDDPAVQLPAPPGAPPPPPAHTDATGPSIFTAFQEQLGLKLDSQKGPGEILVIDRAEKPSEN